MTDEQALREQICEVGRNLWRKDMVAANDGNISALLDTGQVLCTPTGVSKGLMRPEDIAIVDPDGVPVPGTTSRPSSELKMHLRVYREDAAARAVVHAHPLYATSFAVRGRGLRNRMLPETVVGLGEVPLAPYATPSTEAVADSITPLVQKHCACLLENHGALTWGRDLMSAYLTMERLEASAHLMWVAELVGGGSDLPPAEVDRLRTIFGVSS